MAGLTFCVQDAWAQDWVPELQAATGETHGRNDPIVIILPDDLDPAVYPRLAVELDDIDVTAFAVTAPGQLTLNPPEALSTGEHVVRLVERGEDGSIVERGAWFLEVRHSELIRDLSVRADLAGEVNARVLDGGIDTPPQHVTAESGGNLEAAAGDENWRVSLQGNYLYNSQLELGLNERNIDLGEYRLDGDYENEDFFAGLTAGNHDTGIESLIMSGFNRRGVSVRAGTADERISATGFMLRTESIVGTRHVLGISHDEDRIEGGSISVRPIEALKDNILLTGIYYNGEGSDGGFGIGTDEVINDGDGWSVAADTLWFDEALRVRGEFAEATFDFDGKDTGFAPETANAYSVLASLEPLRGSTLGGSTFNWTFGAQREQVDTFFQSLANPSLQADRETTSVFTDFFWDEFAAQLRVDHQLSNVDDFDFLPTDRTVNAYFNGTYTPFVEPLEDGSLPWFGQPFFGLTASVTDIERVETSSDFPEDDADNQSRSLTLSTGSNYATWSWNLSHTLYTFEDQTGFSSDSINNTTGLSAYILIDDWLTLSPNVQYDVFEDRDLLKTSRTINAGLSADITVIPETLTASLNYNLNVRTGDGDTPDSSSFGGEVVWTLREPDANKLGVALAFNGFLQETRNDDFESLEDDVQYQAFTTLRLSLPVSY
ncbi:hypothetical protein HBA54_01015 [Pelagibius litoralis]|uniref:Uncharacterized protein n=1 Tax=Pelagibius litoralis TaxID=374515 RepID=A0A967C9T2_9PROT|nr:hypothetical protein [Pelagibius litoralis]NIA67168.1 hypothetical protein [Pelagibius litoralis]